MAIDDEQPVMGAGGGIGPMPTQADAETAWRDAYVARMVERGIALEDAQACCASGTAVLSDDPAECADDELEYWDNDEKEALDGGDKEITRQPGSR